MSLALCSTCRAGAVIVDAEEPGPLGVFGDPRHSDDQALHGDGPHGAASPRKTT